MRFGSVRIRPRAALLDLAGRVQRKSSYLLLLRPRSVASYGCSSVARLFRRRCVRQDSSDLVSLRISSLQRLSALSLSWLPLPSPFPAAGRRRQCRPASSSATNGSLAEARRSRRTTRRRRSTWLTLIRQVALSRGYLAMPASDTTNVQASAEDIDVAVQAARKAADTEWGLNKTGAERAALMNKFADVRDLPLLDAQQGLTSTRAADRARR